MRGLDLNLIAGDDDEGGDPQFCTQIPAAEGHKNAEGVGDSPSLLAVAGMPKKSSTTARGEPVAMETDSNTAIPAAASNPSGTGNLIPDVGIFALGDGGSDGVEVRSTPEEPYVGMTFDTLEDARMHYNAYAKRLGFSIKSNTSRRSAFTDILEKQQFCCNRSRKPKTDDVPPLPPVEDPFSESECDSDEAGEPQSRSGSSKKSGSGKNVKKRRRQSIVQTACKASMRVKLIDNKFEVISFVPEHNHDLTDKPSLTKYLRSHQGIPREDRKFLETLHSCNLETGRMMSIMSEFYGQAAFVPYTTKGISNLRTSLRKFETKDGDLEATVAYFEEMKKNDPRFFYSVKQDSEGRVENLFWVDGKAREAYAKAYHDCISFDTTYMTNMYNMPFAPFIGINKHGQTFLLGCGFVSQELATSFDWLFGEFLVAMDGFAPLNIITDQDQSMRQSISRMFPTTIHRNCRWHIIRKAQSLLGSYLGRHPQLAIDFNECVDLSMTELEFETNWAVVMHTHGVADNEHFAALYKIRESWVPCYFRRNFFPFLQSTQRSEGFNAVLKRYVNPQNSVLNFVRQYMKINNTILVKEGGNDFETSDLEPRTWSPFPIEKQALKVYTRSIYYRFQHEFEMIGRYNVRPQGGDMFLLVPNNTYVGVYGRRNYMVTALVEEQQYECECCKFYKDGLLCIHILKVFTHIGVDEIPARYILRRWTRDVLQPIAAPPIPDVMPQESAEQIVLANLCTDFAKVARMAIHSEEGIAICKAHIRAARTEVSQVDKVRRRKKKKAEAEAEEAAAQAALASVGTAGSACEPADPGPRAKKLKNPVRTSTKGRKKAVALGSALDLQPKKSIRCGTCGLFGHNAAGCKARLNQSV